MPIYWKTIETDSSKDGYNVVATITPAPTKTYDTAGVHECDVAHDLDISTSETFTPFVNSKTPITPTYNIVVTDTVTRVGGQGRETKFWHNLSSKWFSGEIDVCTMVDTYLATVTRVTERVLDPAGHMITPAYLYLDVYDGQAVGEANKAYIDNSSGLNHTGTQAAHKKAAFETNCLDPATDNKIGVVQKAEPMLGKQTVTYWNTNKHDLSHSITGG